MKNDKIEDLVRTEQEALGSIVENILKITLGQEILNDIPIVKMASIPVKALLVAKDILFIKRMNKFAKAIKDDRNAAEEFEKLRKKEKEAVAEIILSEINEQTNELQSEALGHLFNAYLSKKVSYEIFSAVAHELKNLNPIVFNKNFADFVVVSNNEIFGSGSEYLPIAFKKDMDVSGGGISITGNSIMTNLGLVFYTHVLEKMRKA